VPRSKVNPIKIRSRSVLHARTVARGSVPRNTNEWTVSNWNTRSVVGGLFQTNYSEESEISLHPPKELAIDVRIGGIVLDRSHLFPCLRISIRPDFVGIATDRDPIRQFLDFLPFIKTGCPLSISRLNSFRSRRSTCFRMERTAL
jgi:hypothetical protein